MTDVQLTAFGGIMKSLLTILIVLLAIPVMAQDESDPFPFKYECAATEGVTIEEEFCDHLLQSMLRTDRIRSAEPSDGWFVSIVVQPVYRSSTPDAFAFSIVVTVSPAQMKSVYLTAFQGTYLTGTREAHDEETLNGISSGCIKELSSWLEDADDRLPSDVFTMIWDGSHP